MSDLFGPKSRVRFAVLTRSQLDDVIEGRVTLGAVKVYLSIYARADFGSWSCFPGYDCIRKDLGCSKATVAEAVKRLSELGWVVKTKRRKEGPDGRPVNASNVYLLPHPLAWIAGETVESSVSDLSSPQQGLLQQTLLDQTITRTQPNEEPTSLGASPETELRSPSTLCWERIAESYPGTVEKRSARSAFFSLVKNTPLTPDEIERRVQRYVKATKPGFHYALRKLLDYREGLLSDESLAKIGAGPAKQYRFKT